MRKKIPRPDGSLSRSIFLMNEVDSVLECRGSFDSLPQQLRLLLLIVGERPCASSQFLCFLAFLLLLVVLNERAEKQANRAGKSEQNWQKQLTARLLVCQYSRLVGIMRWQHHFVIFSCWWVALIHLHLCSYSSFVGPNKQIRNTV